MHGVMLDGSIHKCLDRNLLQINLHLRLRCGSFQDIFALFWQQACFSVYIVLQQLQRVAGVQVMQVSICNLIACEQLVEELTGEIA